MSHVLWDFKKCHYLIKFTQNTLIPVNCMLYTATFGQLEIVNNKKTHLGIRLHVARVFWYYGILWSSSMVPHSTMIQPSDIIMLLVWKCKVTLETYSKHLRKCGCLHIEKFYGYSQPVLSARSWNICTRPDWEAPMLKSGRDQKESRVKNGPNFHNVPLRLW